MEGPTPSQTIGPFFGFALPFDGDACSVDPSARGAVRVEGTVLDGAGAPVSDALIEACAPGQMARARTDAEGAFAVTVAKPPGDAGGDAPHLEVLVFARGLLRQLWTRVYFPDEAAANAADAVLRGLDAQRRATLVAADAGGVLRFDIRLQGDAETVFFQAADPG